MDSAGAVSSAPTIQPEAAERHVRMLLGALQAHPFPAAEAGRDILDQANIRGHGVDRQAHQPPGQLHTCKTIPLACKGTRRLGGFRWAYAGHEEGEEWKEAVLPGYSHVYASNHGRIKQHINNDTKIRAGQTRSDCGYKDVYLQHENGSHKAFRAHRVIAHAFHGPPGHESLVVNHIDGVRDNNIPSNLEWVSPRENTNHAVLIGLRSAFTIKQFDSSGCLVKSFPTVKAAMLHMGKCHTAPLYRAISGKAATAWGFSWQKG